MTHPSWQALNDLADGTLSESESVELRLHVARCAQCTHDMIAVETLRREAPRLLGEREAPPVEAVLLAVAGARAASRRRRAVRWAVAAAVVVAVGWSAWAARRDDRVDTVAADRAAVEARVAEQLAIIDGAIAELKVLLEAQPTNVAVRAQLATAERDRAVLGAVAADVIRGAYLTGGM